MGSNAVIRALKGHLFNAANTHLRNGGRSCRTCRKQDLRNFRKRRKLSGV